MSTAYINLKEGQIEEENKSMQGAIIYLPK